MSDLVQVVQQNPFFSLYVTATLFFFYFSVTLSNFPVSHA
jgi:hypothetical protein